MMGLSPALVRAVLVRDADAQAADDPGDSIHDGGPELRTEGKRQYTKRRPRRQRNPLGEDLLSAGRLFANALVGHKLLNAHFTELLTTGKVEAGPQGKYAYGFGDTTASSGPTTANSRCASASLAPIVTMASEAGFKSTS